MNIGNILKVLEYTVLRQSGMAITPEQIGLKTTPASGPFSGYLSNLQGSNQANTFPTPPTPPEDPSDFEAQKLFNEQMVTYNQQVAAYNQRMFSLMMNQFQQLQRQALTQQQTTSRSTSTSASADLGFGSLL